MKLTLTYQFEMPEEEDALQIQLDAVRNYCALIEIRDEIMRNHRKYTEMEPKVRVFFDELDEEIRATMRHLE